MASLADQLRADIGRSALVAVLMSPYYLDSKWCTDEREWWLQAQAKQALPIDERIAVARIWPTAGDWPAGLVDQRGHELVGFCFYDRHFELWLGPGLIELQPRRARAADDCSTSCD